MPIEVNDIPLVHCHEEGLDLSAGDVVEHNGEYFSTDFFAENFSPCFNCQENTRDSSLISEYRRGSSRSFCESCHDDLFTTCDSCETVIDRNEAYNHANSTYCCDCYNEHYSECEGCNRTVPRDEVDGDGHCDRCRESIDAIQGLHDYSYKPRNTFFVLPHSTIQTEYDGKRIALESGLVIYPPVTIDPETFTVLSRQHLYGFELEVEAPDNDTGTDQVSSLHDTGVLYCKNDGSLGDSGFEIVSYPMTFEFWRKVFKERFNKLLARMSKEGTRSHDTTTCGMHVHISSCAFTPLGVYKLQKLVYENPDWILAFSGRGKKAAIESYSAVYDECRNRVNKQYAKKALKRTCDFERYVAVNLRNENTVELRVFKGTLNATTFARNLEFCEACVRYCRVIAHKSVSIESFKTFVLADTTGDLQTLREYFGATPIKQKKEGSK